ncbi:Activated CDC42 kinase 1 [Clarias magur]|uniref:Activated CDC42 kinase 1 n=1 Tax=Clarias magur TaxID=1594786 RepID=A0A8J4TQ87_CLAMG|nr:Activated CDC42 kinase 1 [Clarias magur]
MHLPTLAGAARAGTEPEEVVELFRWSGEESARSGCSLLSACGPWTSHAPCRTKRTLLKDTRRPAGDSLLECRRRTGQCSEMPWVAGG